VEYFHSQMFINKNTINYLQVS